MRTLLRLIVTVVVVLAATHAPLQATDAAAGKELFLKKCKTCHGEDGNGTPAMQKTFGDKLQPLGSAAVQSLDDAALAKAFRAGATHKGVEKSVTDADLGNLIAFIRTLKH